MWLLSVGICHYPKRSWGEPVIYDMPCHKTAHSAMSRLAPDPPLCMCNWLIPPVPNKPSWITFAMIAELAAAHCCGVTDCSLFLRPSGRATDSLSHCWCPGHFPYVPYPQSHQAQNPWCHNSPLHPFVRPNAGRYGIVTFLRQLWPFVLHSWGNMTGGLSYIYAKGNEDAAHAAKDAVSQSTACTIWTSM